MSHPFIAVPRVVGVEIFFRQGSNKSENTLNIYSNAASDPTVMARYADIIRDWLIAYWKPQASNSIVVQGLRLKDRGDQFGAYIDYTPPVQIGGANPNAPAPPNATVSIGFQTGFGGRSYRGRNYYVGLCANHLVSFNPGLITADHQSYLKVSYEQLILALAGYAEPGTLSVVSLYNNNAWRGEGVATPITSIAVDDAVDSQRRRLVGRGI